MMTFEFESEGVLGSVLKLVTFQPTNLEGVYNLVFGDKNTETGLLNDKIATNNGDRDKVLATVAATVYAFTDKNPNAWVYLTGSTKSRTRLYRMGISKFFKELDQDFDVYGQLDDGWVEYKNGIDFEGFLVKRKIK
jgi:hypothetical protein